MARSLTKRGMPKPFAIVIAALLALYFVPLGPLTASAAPSGGEPTLTLNGCRGSVSSYPATGPFVCPDGEYTPGNLQKNWNELDLVPFRVISDSSTDDVFPFTTTLAADYKDKGNTGYDFISVPVVNTRLSHSSCTITDVGPLLLDQASLGGADSTIRRDLTWTQDPNVTCVFDYYQRLALGASKYPGSNLQAYLGVDSGKKTVPLPVGAIKPQQLSKTMTATQGQRYNWSVSKSTNPTSLSFANTCLGQEARTANVTITINWTRSAALADGLITLKTVVTATNPARRNITVEVNDKMYAGTGQDAANKVSDQTLTKLVPAATVTGDDTVVPGTQTFEFTQVVDSTATTFNDVATARYIDVATGVEVPGNTTATASANVTSSNQTRGASATLSDVESISGSGFSYAVNSVTPNTATDTFNGYTLGQFTTGEVAWSDTISPTGTVAASGSYQFSKSVRVASATVGTGSLSDTATINPDGLPDEYTSTASASVGLTADATKPTITITKNVTGYAPDAATDFTFTLTNKSTGATQQVTVKVAAGATSGSTTVTVNPAAAGYDIVENAPPAGYSKDQDTEHVNAVYCGSASVTFTNDVQPAQLSVIKVTDPAGAESGWTFNVTRNGSAFGTLTSGAGGASNTLTINQSGTYVVTEVAKAGWESSPWKITKGSDPAAVSTCSFTVTMPDDAEKSLSCTFYNRQLGKIVIDKVTQPSSSTESFDFSSTAGDPFSLTNAATPHEYTGLTSGLYTVTEAAESGWDLTNLQCVDSISPAGTSTSLSTRVASISLQPGETVTCTFTNTQRAEIIVDKVTIPSGDTTAFPFTATGPNEYSDAFNLKDADAPWSSGAILPGAGYAVSETVPAGWDLTDVTCSDDSLATNISLSPGEVVTCTFTNTKRGELIVDKVTEPSGAGASFPFTVAGGTGTSSVPGFSLTDAAEPHSSGAIKPGAYTITEGDVSGWNLSNLTCDKGAPSYDFANQRVTVNVAPGATVTCTFTNTQEALLIVKKVTQPDVERTFDFNSPVFGEGGISLGNGEQSTPVSLVPGTYQVSEDVPTGWALTNISCDDSTDETGGSSGSTALATATYRLQAGEVVMCTFTNTELSSITVVKQTLPDGSDAEFGFSGDTGSFNLGDGDSDTASGLLPQEGGYTVTEESLAGWDLTGLTCTGAESWSADVEKRSVTIDLQPGEDVTCTFTNTQRGSIVVKKQAVGATTADAGDTFTFTGHAAGSITVPIDGEEEIRVTNLVPGTYTSTEGFTTGWTLRSISCDDAESATASSGNAATSTATFKLDPGETVVCTFENVKPELDKSSNPATTDANPTLVPRASTITYTVTVTNTGAAPMPSSALVDTLPANVSDPFEVTAVQGTWDSYAYDSSGNGKITWMVSLAPGETKVFTYKVTVDSTAPGGGQLLNRVTWQDLEDSTLHLVGVPVPTLDKFSNPVTTDASPTLVQPGTRIDYSVRVGNTGNFPITNAPVVDTLPSNVTAVAGSISDGGVLSTDGKTISWTVTLAAGASKTFTYAATVNQAAPEGAVLVNTAKFQELTDTTTHVVPTGDLSIVKAVSPVAGNGVVVEFGDTLTYTLSVTASGTLDQPNVIVTDYLPGRDPARPESGETRYVAGSAACIGAGTCTVTGPDANGLITWNLGEMAAGAKRQVTFQVVIVDVPGEAGETVVADIYNTGAVQSDRTARVKSNEVVTPVSKVLPVKVVRPTVLPRTGSTIPVGPLVSTGIALLGLGLLLLAATRRRGIHRRG